MLSFLPVKGKSGQNKDLAEQLLDLLQNLTCVEAETSFIRDMGFNFELLETLENARSHMYVAASPSHSV